MKVYMVYETDEWYVSSFIKNFRVFKTLELAEKFAAPLQGFSILVIEVTEK